MTVGKHYKSPLLPIWVVWSESHYSVLFGLERSIIDQTNGGKIDVIYYDELNNQSEEIRLTVNMNTAHNSKDEIAESPIEECIRTKWTNAAVDWNGAFRLV